MKNTDCTFDSFRSMISSEEAFSELMNMIADMDLEFVEAEQCA